MKEMDIFNLDVEASKQRNQAADLKDFKDTVSFIKQSLKVIKDLKTSNSKTAVSEVLQLVML